MFERFGFIPATPASPVTRNLSDSLEVIVAHCRTIAAAHMALAEKVEGLMTEFVENRRFRTGLRTFARYHRRAAWQNLEMANRAEAARKNGYDELEMADVVSA